MMIAWKATFRSLAVVSTGVFVTFCAVKVMTCSSQRTPHVQNRSVHGCAKTKTEAVHATPLNVDVAQFGTQAIDDTGDFVFSETNLVPLKAGAGFGWRLHLKPPAGDVVNGFNKTVRVKEVFVLPSAPAHWGIGAATTLSDDLTTATTEERVVLDDTRGWLASSWSVSRGDPPGDYKMLVYLDDQLVKTFEFSVEEPEAKQTNKIKHTKRIKRTKRSQRHVEHQEGDVVNGRIVRH